MLVAAGSSGVVHKVRAGNGEDTKPMWRMGVVRRTTYYRQEGARAEGAIQVFQPVKKGEARRGRGSGDYHVHEFSLPHNALPRLTSATDLPLPMTGVSVILCYPLVPLQVLLFFLAVYGFTAFVLFGALSAYSTASRGVVGVGGGVLWGGGGGATGATCVGTRGSRCEQDVAEEDMWRTNGGLYAWLGAWGRRTVGSRSDSVFRFLTPICMIFRSRSLLKLCAFEWLQSSSSW